MGGHGRMPTSDWRIDVPLYVLGAGIWLLVVWTGINVTFGNWPWW